MFSALEHDTMDETARILHSTHHGRGAYPGSQNLSTRGIGPRIRAADEITRDEKHTF